MYECTYYILQYSGRRFLEHKYLEYSDASGTQNLSFGFWMCHGEAGFVFYDILKLNQPTNEQQFEIIARRIVFAQNEKYVGSEKNHKLCQKFRWKQTKA